MTIQFLTSRLMVFNLKLVQKSLKTGSHICCIIRQGHYGKLLSQVTGKLSLSWPAVLKMPRFLVVALHVDVIHLMNRQ